MKKTTLKRNFAVLAVAMSIGILLAPVSSFALDGDGKGPRGRK